VHVALMGELKNSCNTLVSKSEGKSHLGDLYVDGRIILESILGK